MQNQSKQFFKVLPSQFLKIKQKPSLQSYQTILQVLKNRNYLYVDFHKHQNDNLVFLQKTESPIANHSQQHDEDDIYDKGANDVQSLGNKFIMDMNHLSRPSYKMLRYVSESKRLMKKRKSVSDIQSTFIRNMKKKDQQNAKQIRFGPLYRKSLDRTRKLQYSSKIEPEKLEEYLQGKNYHKIERRLQKSEHQLEKFLLSMKQLKEKQRQDEFSRILERTNTKDQNNILTELSQKTSFQMNLLSSRKKRNVIRSSSLTKSESENLTEINKEIENRIKFPKIRRLSKVLAQSFSTAR